MIPVNLFSTNFVRIWCFHCTWRHNMPLTLNDPSHSFVHFQTQIMVGIEIWPFNLPQRFFCLFYSCLRHNLLWFSLHQTYWLTFVDVHFRFAGRHESGSLNGPVFFFVLYFALLFIIISRAGKGKSFIDTCRGEIWKGLFLIVIITLLYNIFSILWKIYSYATNRSIFKR